MTKLMQWLCLLALIVGVWFAILTQNVGNLATDYPNLSFLWPIGLVIVVGIWCLCLIVYRVLTFNDCPEAAEELQREIKAAKEDLKKKGLKFWATSSKDPIYFPTHFLHGYNSLFLQRNEIKIA